jgi:regulator of sigma E protease
MPAYHAGIQPDDHIRAVNGQPVKFWEDMVKKIHDAPRQPMRLQIERQGAVREVTVTPVVRKIVDLFGKEQEVGMIGVASKGTFETYRVGPVEALGKAMEKLNEWTVQTVTALWSMVTGKVPFRDSMTGPIGLVVITSEAVALGIAPVLFLISLFSLSLAIFNVFPIPVLDGGHLLFLAIETLRGRPVSMRVQERAAQVSFFLLITLILVICVNDMERFGIFKKLRDLFGG